MEEKFEMYVGVKLVFAKPMTLNEAETLLHREINTGDKGNAEGYLVEYDSNYQSWCPKVQFEKANRLSTGMPFGHAIEAARKGHKIARDGWNGKGMFLYYVSPSFVDNENLRGNAKLAMNHDGNSVAICGHLDMKSANGSIVVGWLASQTDMLSDDWMIVDL